MEMQPAMVNGQPSEVGQSKRNHDHGDSFPWDDDNCNSLSDEAANDGSTRPANMYLPEGVGMAHNSGQGSMGIHQAPGGDGNFLLGYQQGHGGGSQPGGTDHLGKHPEYVSVEDLHKGDVFRCDVCHEAFHADEALKEHMARTGHFKCSVPGCPSQLFTTIGELVAHQETAHGSQQFGPNSQLYDTAAFQHDQQYMQQPDQFQNFQQQQNLQAVDNFLQQTHHLGQQISIQPRSFNSEQQQSQFADQTSQHSLNHMSSQSQHSSEFTQYGDGSNMQTSQSTPQVQARPFSNLAQASPSNSPVKPVSPHPQIQVCAFSNLAQQSQGLPNTPQLPGITITPQKRAPSGEGPETPTKKHVTELLVGSGQEKLAQTLSKMGQGQESRQAADKGNASSVANMLATRGITVTPSGSQKMQQQQPQQQQQQQQQQLPVTKSSSLSITPSQGSGVSFPVPQGRGLVSRQQQQQRAVHRPDRPPTVDLTREMSPPRQLQPHLQPQPRQVHPQAMVGRMRGRARPAGIGRFTCQICHKVFSSMETLGNHMNLHRSPGKPPYRCTNCPAQYSSHHGLLIHQQACLRNLGPQPGKARQSMPNVGVRQQAPMRQASSSSVSGQAPIIGQQQAGDYGLIVVDMRNPATVNRLRSLGVTSYLPFPSAGNIYGIPLINANRPGNVGYLGVTHMILMGSSMPLPR